MKPAPSRGSRSEIVVYQTDDQRTSIQVRLEGGTVWLTQAQIGELFQTTPQDVTIHLKTIFAEGELEQGASCKDRLQVRNGGLDWADVRPRIMAASVLNRPPTESSCSMISVA